MAEQHPDKVEVLAAHKSANGSHYILRDHRRLLDSDVITPYVLSLAAQSINQDFSEYAVPTTTRDEILLMRAVTSLLTGIELSTPDDSDWIRTWHEAIEILNFHISTADKQLRRISVVDPAAQSKADIVRLNYISWIIEPVKD